MVPAQPGPTCSTAKRYGMEEVVSVLIEEVTDEDYYVTVVMPFVFDEMDAEMDCS